jgi:hypothetical protein
MAVEKLKVSKVPACGLCGLDVKVTGFELDTRDGKKVFCCQGCKAIFKLLHTESVLPQSD